MGIGTEEAEEIVNEYCEHTNGFFDRNLIGNIYDDFEDVGMSEVSSYGNVPEWLDDYIDYESVGRDYVNANYCWELADGRILTFEE